MRIKRNNQPLRIDNERMNTNMLTIFIQRDFPSSFIRQQIVVPLLPVVDYLNLNTVNMLH